jgi:tight adherence protein B
VTGLTRDQVLLATAAECLLLIWVVRHWWRVLMERHDLLARSGAPPAATARRQLRRSLDRTLRRTGPGRRLGDRLDRAALPLTVLEAVLAGTVAAALCCWLISLLFNRTFAVASLVAAPFVGAAVLTGFIRRRAAAMVDQLPELAGALASAASAGLSLPSALRLAADDLADPVAGELRHALDSLAVGYTMDGALREIARRLPSRELDLLITTLVVQARGGGNLVQALRRLSDALERRRDTRREASSMTAGSASTAYLMVFFGFGITAVLQRAYPGSLDRTMSSHLGLLAVTISCALYVVGILLVRRTVRTRE